MPEARHSVLSPKYSLDNRITKSNTRFKAQRNSQTIKPCGHCDNSRKELSPTRHSGCSHQRETQEKLQDQDEKDTVDEHQAQQEWTARGESVGQAEDSIRQYSSSLSNTVHHQLLSPPKSQDVPATCKREREEKEDQKLEAVATQGASKRLKYGAHATNNTETPSALRQAVHAWIDSEFHWSGACTSTTDMEGRTKTSLSSLKRTASSASMTDSYAKAVKSGNAPRAWGRQHAQVLQQSGILMEGSSDAAIVEEDQQLCDEILRFEFQLPTEWKFESRNIPKILARVRYRNEARVEQDLTPIISPSAEMLHDMGHQGFDHIEEGVDAEWSKISYLYGPRPKPDATYGLSRNAFTSKEREKLTSQNTAVCEDHIFPFHVRQAKSIERSIEEAELQALHNASVAMNTVVELYQSVQAVSRLHRRVLAFSMVHNHHLVKTFAHFVMVHDERTTFHRHMLFQVDLNDSSSEFSRPYKILVGICKLFAPRHLQRIRDALELLPERAMESFAAQTLGLEEDVTPVPTPSSSQDKGQSKRRAGSSIAGLLEENARAREQVIEVMRRTEDQLEKQRQKSHEQLEQERQKSHEQLEQQRQKSHEQLEQQRQEAREQLERQHVEFREQQRQMNELIKLLRSEKAESSNVS